MSKLVTLNEDIFENEVENSELPVLVEFGASWCGPCNRQLPILESLAKSYVDQLKVVKVDIDDCPQLCEKFSVKSVPTLMIFKQGNVVHSGTGLTTLQDLKAFYLSKVGI